MSKVYKLLWSLAILFIVATLITFAFGLLLIGLITVGLYGAYRYYLLKRKLKKFKKTWSESSFTTISTGEIIDISKKVSP